jgi:hypothetical protein
LRTKREARACAAKPTTQAADLRAAALARAIQTALSIEIMRYFRRRAEATRF